ncbi:MAG: SPOR domain-containing protein [bacterium]|nr:MAG: SPOR domain-containing protein [bacterium]
MFRKIVISIILLVSITAFLGCASSKKEKVEPGVPEASDRLDESFDPLSLDDDDIAFKTSQPQTVKEAPVYLPLEKPTDLEDIPVENIEIGGFRIQLLSTKDLESATRAKAIAMEQFEDVRVKFYLEFDSPYYKVRLGDFQSREEAEDIREVVRSRGYPKAWIVKSKVWSNPEFPVQEDSTAIDSPEIY